MAKNVFYFFGILVLVAVAGFFILGAGAETSQKNSGTQNSGASGSGDFQKVTLSIKNYNYYPNTVTVKEGQPVRIYLDATVSGCLRSFTIKDFGIAKNLPTPNDYIEFTPDKKGTFRFACSMGMGYGTLIVE